MILVRSLLLWFCSFLQLDEPLSLQATDRRVLVKLTRNCGVFPFSKNVFSSLMAELTCNLLTSHNCRPKFRRILRTGGQQNLFYPLKQGGVDSLLRVLRESLNLLSMLCILTDKRVKNSFKLGFFLTFFEFDLFS